MSSDTVYSGRDPSYLSSAFLKMDPMSHSNVPITLDTDSHVLPDMRDEFAIAVANLLKREPQMD